MDKKNVFAQDSKYYMPVFSRYPVVLSCLTQCWKSGNNRQLMPTEIKEGIS